MPGQEGVPSVFSPMARTLNDLTYFTRSIIGMQPWKYDYTVHPITWREDQVTEVQGKKLRIGLMTSDGKTTSLLFSSKLMIQAWSLPPPLSRAQSRPPLPP